MNLITIILEIFLRILGITEKMYMFLIEKSSKILLKKVVKFSVPRLVGFKYWIVEFAQDGPKVSFFS